MPAASTALFASAGSVGRQLQQAFERLVLRAELRHGLGRLVGLFLQPMQRERGVVPRLAIRVGHLDGGVADHPHRLGRDVLTVDDQRDAIFARHDKRPIVRAAAEPTAAAPTAPAGRLLARAAAADIADPNRRG